GVVNRHGLELANGTASGVLNPRGGQRTSTYCKLLHRSRTMLAAVMRPRRQTARAIRRRRRRRILRQPPQHRTQARTPQLPCSLPATPSRAFPPSRRSASASASWRLSAARSQSSRRAARNKEHSVMTLYRKGVGIGENFCPTLPYNCPPRPWGPDEGPNVSIADRLGTGTPPAVGTGLACWPREWKPVGVDGFHIGLPKIHIDFGKIPYVGKALQETYETVTAGVRIPLEYASKVAHGQNIVQAAKDQLAHEVKVYRTAASYAQL